MQSLLPYKQVKFLSVNELYSTKINDIKYSKPIMTKYEFNQIISQRATMLAHGSPTFVPTDNLKIKTNLELRDIAIRELKENKLPLMIQRPLPNNKFDLYRIKDLDLVAVQHMIR